MAIILLLWFSIAWSNAFLMADREAFPEGFHTQTQYTLLETAVNRHAVEAGNQAITACDEAAYQEVRQILWQDIRQVNAERGRLKTFNRQDFSVTSNPGPDSWVRQLQTWDRLFQQALDHYHGLRVRYTKACSSISPPTLPLTQDPFLPLNSLNDLKQRYTALKTAVSRLTAEAKIIPNPCDPVQRADLVRQLDRHGLPLKQLSDRIRQLRQTAPGTDQPLYDLLMVDLYDLAYAMIDSRNRLIQSPCATIRD